MSAETPIQAVREAIHALLIAANLGVQIYKIRPTEGVRAPCVVMQKIGGPGERPAGLGQVYSSTRKGVYIIFVFQIDIFHNNTADLDALTDRVLTLLVEKTIEVGDSRLEVKLRRGPLEVPEGELGERIYHVNMDFEIEAPLTWT